MKYLTNHSLITLSVGMSLAACAASADEEGVRASAPGVSAEASGEGARASAGPVDAKTAQLALDELSGNVDVTVDGFHTRSVPPPPDAQPTAPPGSQATQDINVACAAGGDAAVDGYVNVQPVPVAVDVKLAIAFNNCATRTGTTINGDIDFSQSVVTGPETPLQIETLYQGDVALAGRVNVSCPVDLNVLVDETGRAVKVQGMFCNQDASALELQLQPRWQASAQAK
jgi:hypothetical protein